MKPSNPTKYYLLNFNVFKLSLKTIWELTSCCNLLTIYDSVDVFDQFWSLFKRAFCLKGHKRCQKRPGWMRDFWNSRFDSHHMCRCFFSATSSFDIVSTIQEKKVHFHILEGLPMFSVIK